MKSKYTKLLFGYYCLVLLVGLYNCITELVDKRTFIEHFRQGIHASSYILLTISGFLFLLSIIIIVTIRISKLSKLHLVFPIYYIGIHVLWFWGLTAFIARYGTRRWGAIKSVEMLNTLSSFDIFVYLLNVVLSTFFLYQLYREFQRAK